MLKFPSLGTPKRPGFTQSECLTREERQLHRSKVQRVIDAAGAGDLDTVKRILERKILVSDVSAEPEYDYECDVNAMGTYRNTALHTATEHGHDHVVTYLLERGANAHAANMYGYLPLHCAARHGAFGVVMQLLKAGCDVDVNAKDAKGNTPLHLAGRHQHSERVIRLLCEFSADVNAVNARKESPLMISCQANTTQVALEMLACGADVNLLDEHGRSPLHWACSFGNLTVISALRDAGAKIRAVDDEGNTPLHRAATSTLAAVKLVHGYGAWLDARNKRDETALHVAARFGKHDIVEYFAEKGAYMAARTAAGETATHIAKSNERSRATLHLAKSDALAFSRKTEPESWETFRNTLHRETGDREFDARARERRLKASEQEAAFMEAERRYRVHRTILSSPKRRPPGVGGFT